MKLFLTYFGEVLANPTVPAPRRVAKMGNATAFVTLLHQFCDDSAAIH